MNWRSLRLRCRSSRLPVWGKQLPPPLRGYSSILSASSEEEEDANDDKVYLLKQWRPMDKTPSDGSTGSTTSRPMGTTKKPATIRSWWRQSVRTFLCGWSQRQVMSTTTTSSSTPPSNHHIPPAASVATSPTIPLETPTKDKRTFPKARPTEKPLYYIISDVGSTYLGAHVQSQSSGLDEEDQRRKGPLRSLGLCFERKRNTSPSTEPQGTEHDTVTLSYPLAGRSFSDSSMTSTSEDMPPPILRSFSFEYPSPVGRASGIVPGNVKFLEAEEETGAATRELIRILTIPPLLPFRALQREKARPTPPVEEPSSTLGISGAHPLWIEREKRNVWDEVVSDSFSLDDISVVRPSPIQVEPCASSSWLDEMFSDTSSNSVMTGLDKIFIPNNKENRKCHDSEPPTTGRVSPLEWMTKLYQPILRATKDIPVCGNLGQVVFEDAPLDELNNDTSRVPLGEIRNKRATRHKPVVPRPLKPCPKDTPSIQQVYHPRTSPWETFK